MAVHHLKPAAKPPVEPAGAATAPRQPPGRRWRWIAALAVLATVGAGGGWWFLRPVEVSMGEAHRGPAIEAVYASGVVDYVHQARIAPVLTAPIRAVLVEERAQVRPGQLLAQLDDGPQQGTALQLEAQAAQARAAADRQRRLYDAGFGAKAALDDAETQRRAAEGAAASARARLRDYRLTAPFAGQVLRRDAEPGDLATAGKVAFVVADPRSLRITADVDERDVGRLATGLPALVRADAYPGQTFEAKVSEITPQGDAAGRVFRVRLQLGADTPLKPGMTVETNIVVARRETALLAPSAAVKDGVVWRVRDGKARKVAVRVGAASGPQTEVVSGLTAGDRLVLDPPKTLRDGRRVRAKAH